MLVSNFILSKIRTYFEHIKMPEKAPSFAQCTRFVKKRVMSSLKEGCRFKSTRKFSV